MNKELWEKCVEFHGHECPGLAIGFKASEAAREKMALSFSKDEEIVCVTENDACGVDAVQVITGCSVGKGNLIFKDGEALRIVLKSWNRNGDRQKDMKYMLDASYEELFDFKKPNFTVPENARLFNNITCEACGESTAECKIRVMDGKKVCGDCFKEYSRGF